MKAPTVIQRQVKPNWVAGMPPPNPLSKAQMRKNYEDCSNKLGIPKCQQEYTRQMMDFRNKPHPSMERLAQISRGCHNKYVKGQVNKHGHPLHNIYSDHPNWIPYRRCMEPLKQLEHQYEQSIPKPSKCAQDFMDAQEVLRGVYRKEMEEKMRRQHPVVYRDRPERPRYKVPPTSVNQGCLKKCEAGVLSKKLGRGATRVAMRECKNKCSNWGDVIGGLIGTTKYTNYNGNGERNQIPYGDNRRRLPPPLPSNYVELQIQKAKDDYKKRGGRNTKLQCVDICARELPTMQIRLQELQKQYDKAPSHTKADIYRGLMIQKGHIAYQKTWHNLQCGRHYKVFTEENLKKYLPYIIGGVLLIMLLKK